LVGVGRARLLVGKAHTVPLAQAALDLLDAAAAEFGNDGEAERRLPARVERMAMAALAG